MLEWSNEIGTGIFELDTHHKEFHDRLNQFLRANIEAKGGEHVEQLLSFLGNYSTEQFRIEERYMQLYRYPEAEKHKEEHLGFHSFLNRLEQAHAEKGTTSTIVLELQHHMGDWFVHHIAMADRSLGRFLKPFLHRL